MLTNPKYNLMVFAQQDSNLTMHARRTSSTMIFEEINVGDVVFFCNLVFY